MKVLAQKIYQDHVPCSFAYKVVCIDDKLSQSIVVFRGANVAYEFLKQFLRNMSNAKK